MQELLQQLIDRLTTLEREFDSLPDLSKLIKDIEALKQNESFTKETLTDAVTMYGNGYISTKSEELFKLLNDTYEKLNKENSDNIDIKANELNDRVSQELSKLISEYNLKAEQFKKTLSKMSNDYQIEVDNKVNDVIFELKSKLRLVKNGIDGKDGVNGKDGSKGDKGDKGLDGNDGVGISDITYKSNTLTIFLSNNTKKEIRLNIPQYLGGGGGGVSAQFVYNAINEALGGATGTGDMLKSVYDTNNSGIVDNSEKVNGLTVETAVPVNAVFTDTIYDDTAILSSLSNKIESSLIGTSNGLATLDSNSKITLSQIPDSILGQLEYQGVYDFSSSLPTATQKGQYWICSVSGNGYVIGDWAVWNGALFDKVDNTDAVSSVNGQTGNVNIINISGNAETVTNGLYTTDIENTIQPYNANTVIDASYVHTDNNFTTILKNKLDGIASGAEVNVNSDWNAISGDAQILNKPTTLSGYGITDVYSKTEIDTMIGNINSALDTINGQVI